MRFLVLPFPLRLVRVCEGLKFVDSHYEIIDMVLAMAFGPRFVVLRAGLHGSRISCIWASAKH